MPVSTDHQLITRALDIQAPWRVYEVTFDAVRQTWVLGIESAPIEQLKNKSWFATSKHQTQYTHSYHWLTLPLHGHNCEVVLRLQSHESIPTRPWTNAPQMPFTRLLEATLEDYMLAGMTVQGICQTLRLPLQKVWQLKYRLQFGSQTPQTTHSLSNTQNQAPAGRTFQTTRPSQEDSVAASGFEDLAFLYQPESKVWTYMVRGYIQIHTADFGLRLLLAQILRSSRHMLQDHGEVKRAAQKIQRYFLRHQARLSDEMEQILQADQRMDSAGQALPTQKESAVAGSQKKGLTAAQIPVPGPTQPVWIDLLTGHIDIQTDTLSLQLMLTKLRKQIDQSRSINTLTLRALELNRYFEMNQHQLEHELIQLNTLARTPSSY